MHDAFQQRRRNMLNEQLLARGIAEPLVLGAMDRVPREEFVSPDQKQAAYEDRPLPIGEGQTISQPYIVAYMIEALGLRSGETVLEVGTGSGYAAAVLTLIAGSVFTVERIKRLASNAADRLQRLNYDNVHVREGDGSIGWPEAGPFDAIVVTASGPTVPQTLRQQLKTGGRLVMPVGASWRGQKLVRVTRKSEQTFAEETLTFVAFVPLIGAEGWQDERT